MKPFINGFRLARIGLRNVTDRVLIRLENRERAVAGSTINYPVVELRVALGDDTINASAG